MRYWHVRHTLAESYLTGTLFRQILHRIQQLAGLDMNVDRLDTLVRPFRELASAAAIPSAVNGSWGGYHVYTVRSR